MCETYIVGQFCSSSSFLIIQFLVLVHVSHNVGAFSTVKYARQIVKERTRSNWPEYAVKIVSTQKIEELGYEQSINREIAILRTLSHPGISRLISSFRFRDGAYLVLEYASGGDLHTLLKKNGSLDHESTRFVVGSVAAALGSIHERGFVYADCKPEVRLFEFHLSCCSLPTLVLNFTIATLFPIRTFSLPRQDT